LPKFIIYNLSHNNTQIDLFVCQCFTVFVFGIHTDIHFIYVQSKHCFGSESTMNSSGFMVLYKTKASKSYCEKPVFFLFDTDPDPNRKNCWSEKINFNLNSDTLPCWNIDLSVCKLSNLKKKHSSDSHGYTLYQGCTLGRVIMKKKGNIFLGFWILSLC